MLHTIRLAVILGILWLLLSGYYSWLMLSFGAVSVAVVVWLTSRMDQIDKERFTLYVTADFIVFMLKLAKRIVISNIDVTKCILGLKPVSSGFIEITLPFDDELTKVLYANAITLTPGSSSITMTDSKLLVHTLTEDSAKDLIDGDMLSIIPRTREQRKAQKSGGPKS